MALLHGNTKEPSTAEISVRTLDAEMVAQLIEGKYGIRLAANSVGRLLAQLGITPQKPLYRAMERDEALVKNG